MNPGEVAITVNGCDGITVYLVGWLRTYGNKLYIEHKRVIIAKDVIYNTYKEKNAYTLKQHYAWWSYHIHLNISIITKGQQLRAKY